MRNRQLAICVTTAFLLLSFQNCSPFDALAAKANSNSETRSLASAMPTGLIQGMKIDENGAPFVNATLAIRTTNELFYAPQIASHESTFFSHVPAGMYELGAQQPDDYDIYYSLCRNCIDHPASSWVSYGAVLAPPLIVEVKESEYVDLWWKIVRKSNTMLATNQLLTCAYDGLAIPPTTNSVQFQGTSVAAEVAISGYFGGIPTSLKLKANGAAIDILEARSAAGSSWQTSFLMYDRNSQKMPILNQAAGNVAQQWGFAGNHVVSASGLNQADWNPMYTDHYLNGEDFSLLNISTSPCFHTGYRTFDGQASINEARLGGGDLIRIKNEYRLRASMRQNWSWFVAEQALFLNKRVAKQNNLRLYLFGNGWSEGPLLLEDTATFNIIHASWGVRDANADQFHTDPLTRALLVYSVGGVDVGVAIHRENGGTFEAQIASTRNVVCGGGYIDETCGNLEFHSWVEDSRFSGSPSRAFNKGDVSSYSMVYDVGTLAQLKAAGFGFP